MSKTVAIYSALLVVALLAAYLSWTAEEEPEVDSRNKVVLVDKTAEELESITYEEDGFSVTLEPRKDAHGEYVWADTKRLKTPEPAKDPSSNPHDHDAGVPDEPAPAAKPEETVRSFKTGNKGESVVEALAPFRALRKLEGASKEREASFGLDDPRGTLTLKYSGLEKSYDVGGEGYGHRDIYVRDKADGAIYLVEANTIRPLRYADSRMTEKEFHGYPRSEVKELIISDGTSRIEAVQKNRDDQSKRMWVPRGEDIRTVPLETWIQKFERTRGTGYAKPGEAEGADKVLSVKVVGEKGATTVDLLRGQTEQGDPMWYMRSEFTRGAIQIPTALGLDLSTDFPTVVDAVKEAKNAEPAAE